MSFYKFQAPSQWNGFRDIDEEIDQEKINMELNYAEEDQNMQEEEGANTADDGKKSKKSSDAKRSRVENNSESQKSKSKK